MDVELWRSNEDQAWRRHLGSVGEPSRKHLGDRGLEAEDASGRDLEVRSQKSGTLPSYNAQHPPKVCFY